MIEQGDLKFFILYDFGQLFGIACVFWCAHMIAIRFFEKYIQPAFKKTIILPELLVCFRCFGFWSILILTYSIPDAAIVAVFIHTIDKISLFLESNSRTKIE